MDGNLFFKAVSPPLRHEAALTELLGKRRPDCIPPPLAVDRDRGWMLMVDGGQTLRDADRGRARPESLARRAPALRGRPDRPDGRRGRVARARRAGLPARVAAGEGRGAARRDRRAARRGAAPARSARCPGLALRARSSPPRGSPRRSSTTICTTPRSSFATAATCSSTGATPASRTPSSPLPSRSTASSPGASTTCRAPSRRSRTVTLTWSRSAGYDRSDLVALAQTARRLGWLCRALNSRRSQPSDESTSLRLRMFLDGEA